MRRDTFRKATTHLGVWLLVAAGTASARAGTDSWTPVGPSQGHLTAVAASARGDLFAVAALGFAADLWQLPAGAGTWRWRSDGLGQPYVHALAAHPTRPDELWAVSGFTFTVYRSIDGGASWQPTGRIPGIFQTADRSAAGAASQPATGGVSAGLIFPLFPQRLWLAPAAPHPVLFAELGDPNDGDRLLLRSVDGGASWTEVQGAVGPVAAPPDEPQVVYAAAARGGRVMRSRNGGKSFQVFRPRVDGDDRLLALHATRGRNPMVFASFATGGLFRSIGGSRWDPVGFAGAGPSALTSDPRDPRRVYAASAAGIYTSTRSGRPGSFTFQDFLPQGVVREARAIVIGPNGPLVLAGGDLRGPGAAVLAETGITSFDVAEVRVAQADGDVVAVRRSSNCSQSACDLHTLLSTDGGATFQRLGFPVLPRLFADVRELAFDPDDASRQLAVFSVGGLHLTEPQGSRWLQANLGLVVTSTVEITGGGGLLAGGTSGILLSQDGGATWRTTLPSAVGSMEVFDLRADVGTPESVLALAVTTGSAATGRGFRSLDSGATWVPLLAGRTGVVDAEAVPGRPATVYVLVAGADGSELLRSDDDGRTAVPVHTFPRELQVSDVAVDPVVPTDLYAASAAGVLRSRDGGTTWATTPGPPTAWGPHRQNFLRVWVDPTTHGHLYAMPRDGGLFENRLSD